MNPGASPLLILATGLIFYVFVPGVGAFAVRKQWRVFRRRAIDGAGLPLLSYGDVRRLEVTPVESSAESPVDGARYRFFGALEAIEDDDIIWLRSGGLSVAVEMRGARVHLLPPEDFGITVEEGGEQFPDRTPSVLRWQRMTSLTEGSKIYVAGQVVRRSGRAVFVSPRSEPLLVVMYDGPEETVVRRSVWCGRQRNEYWNQLTPMSLAGGILTLSVLAYLAVRPPTHGLAAVLSGAGALLPVLPLAPPGVALYFLYRGLWKAGRYRRARRDLEILECGGEGKTPHARRAGREAALLELLSIACFVAGLVINAVLALAAASYLLL